MSEDDARVSALDKAIIGRIRELPYPLYVAINNNGTFKYHLKKKIKKMMLELVGPDCEVQNDELKLYDEGANDTKNIFRNAINEL